MKSLVLLLALIPLLAAADWHPSLPAPGSLDGLGVNIHFTKPEPGELEMIKAAGFRWVRQDITWAGVEKKVGEYDFSAYDGLAAALEKNGLKAYFILDYGNPLYADPGDQHPFTSRAGTEEFRAAYARWAAATVAHFAGRGYLFELWNEPNHEGFWKPKPNAADYAAMAKGACVEIQKVAPKEALVGPATSTIDLPFIEECFRVGLLEHWAAVSVHPYRQQRPETVEAEYRQLRMLIHRYAPDRNIPILSGEWGYSTAWSSLGPDEPAREQTQAQYLARMFLTNIANDVPISIWYDWRDDGNDPKESEHRFGIVRRAFHTGASEPFEPKPAYLAARTLTSELAGFRFNKRLCYGPDDRQLLFEQGVKLRFATHCDGAPRAWLSAQPGKFGVRELSGEARIESAVFTDGIAGLQLKETVEFIRPIDPQPAWEVARSWSCLPLEWLVRYPAETTIEVVATGKNLTDGTLVVDSGTRDNLLGCIMIPPHHGEERVGSGMEFRHSGQVTLTNLLPSEDIRQHLYLRFLDGREFKFHQRSILVAMNPLDISGFVTGDGQFCLRLGNPSGDVLHGKLTLGQAFKGSRTERLENRTDLLLEKGQTEKIIRAPEVKVDQTPFDCMLCFTWDKGPEALSSVRVFQPSVSFSSTALATRTDGAKEVEGHLTIKDAVGDAQAPVPGMPSLAVSYSFGRGWKFGQIVPSDKNSAVENWIKETAPNVYTLWIRGDGRGLQPRIRFVDATGQTFQSDGQKLDFNGWRLVKFPLRSEPETPLNHWGGANDGEVHLPVKWDNVLLLDNVSREPLEGEIQFAAPTLTYERK